MKKKLLAKFRMLEFMKAVRQDSRPLIVGRHTSAITTRLDRAMYDYKNGKSTYLICTVPFRHGKSEIISRHFPPFFLGHNPESEIILSTYGEELSQAMSRDARNVFKSPEYSQVFPSLKISSESASVSTWGIRKHYGKFQSCTISAGATGKGADVLIIDDYLRGRSIAESETERNKQWDNFRGNLITRLAPVHIVIILATPWHRDDIIGRIKNRNDKNSEDYNPDFPKYEIMSFPARDINGNYLFPERFSAEWYEKQFATLGSYQSAALLQCEPVLRGGNMLKVDNVNIIDKCPSDIRYYRFWDLASGEKERAKADPDFTAGALVGVRRKNNLWQLFIKDLAFCQKEALERNNLILKTTDRDGSSVRIGVESAGGYKDTYTILKSILEGRRIVDKVTVSSDKVSRAGEMEPLFEVGNVFMERAWWNKAALEQLREFPSGAHDDFVDAISGGFIMSRKRYTFLKRTITVS
jgi:predicted phage terminase large subunit-like protein